MNTHIFVIKDIEKIRLDKFLSTNLDISRNQLEYFIKNIGVLVNRKKVKKCGFMLLTGYRVELTLLDNTKNIYKKEIDFDIPIIYEDDDILVINKPSGVSTHRAVSEKNPTVVDWLESKNISLSTISGEDRYGIVHRLDKPTSGIMVVAKNNNAHINLSEQLQKREMGRYYIAIISPCLKDDCIIDKSIGRSKSNRIKMTTQNPVNPRTAKTYFKKIQMSKDLTCEFIIAKLFTGRTHQIRAHLGDIQRCILGDIKYGYKRKWQLDDKIFLQAYHLYLKHPSTGENLKFSCRLDDNIKEFCSKNFDEKDLYEKIDNDNINTIFNSFI